MMLGERVALDRVRRGWSQRDLASRLHNASGAARLDPDAAKPSRRTVEAWRAWLAKLESGKLKRELSRDLRDLLASSLLVEEGELGDYRTLPVRQRDNGIQTDERGELHFEELWVFSRSPLETEVPSYARDMLIHLVSEDGRVLDRPLVYFVSSKEVARRLAATFLSASQDQPAAREAVAHNLFIEVVRNGTAFMPHWIIQFTTSRLTERQEYTGFVRLEGEDGKRRFGVLPRKMVDEAVFGLLSAGMLTPNLRYLKTRNSTAEVDGMQCERFPMTSAT